MKPFKLVRKTIGIIPGELRGRGFVLFVLLFLGSVLDLLGLAAVLPLFQLVLEEDFLKETPMLLEFYEFVGFDSRNEFIILIAVLVVTVIVIKNIFLITLQYLQSKYAFDIYEKIAYKCYEQTYNKGYLFFKNINSNEVIRNISHIPRMFSLSFLIPLFVLVNEIIVVILICAGLLIINPGVVALLLLLISPVIIVFYRYVRKRILNLEQKNIDILPVINKSIFDMIFGYTDISVSNSIGFFGKRYKGDLRTESSQRTLISVYSSITSRIVEISAVLAIVTIFIYGLYQLNGSGELISILSLFALAAFRLIPSFNKVVQSLILVKGKEYTLDYLSELEYSTASEVKEELVFNSSIRLKDLAFSYSNESGHVLRDLNVTIKKGEVVGVVGHSGSGKTTVMNLILGFVPPTEGQVLIDDVELCEQNINSWRSHIGYVSQDVFIIDGTLVENIAFGEDLDKVDLERIDEVLKKSSLFDAVQTWKEGIHTRIGERGAKISGGQKQRIGIARALYKGAEVLLFDEATSALDNKTEKEVTDSIQKLTSDKLTMIIVAHRLSTLKHCNRILELEQGHIAKQASYEEIISND